MIVSWFLRSRRRKTKSHASIGDAVVSSGYFHAAWYILKNPDVKAAGMDPLEHFCLYGDREFRSPGLLFDSAGYVEAWDDVKSSGMGALQHFLTIGRSLGRAAPSRKPVSLSRLIFKRARYALQSGQFRRALRLARLARRHYPSLETAVLLFEVCVSRGDHQAAFDRIEEACALPNPTFDVMLEYALAAARIGRHGPAIEKLEALNLARPDDGRVGYALASMYANTSAPDRADALFARDLQVICGNGAIARTGVLSLQRLSRLKGETDCARQDLRYVIAPPSSAAGHQYKAVYLVAADSVYFCRYAQHVLNSFNTNDEMGALVHFHVINPTDEAKQIARSLRELRAKLAVSEQIVDVSTFTPHSRRTYYACARYLITPEILNAYQRPLIVADMDQLLMAPLTPFLNQNAHSDVGLLRFDHQMANLFSSYSATLMVIHPTMPAHQFVRFLARAINDAMERGRDLTWHLDQAMIALTKILSPEVKFSFFSPSFVDLGNARKRDSSTFWSITNSIEANERKLHSHAFQQFRRKVAS